MHYVYDFDSTLYATEQLWRLWTEILRGYGKSEEEISAVWDAMKPSVVFTPQEHARRLGLKPHEIEAAAQAEAEGRLSSGRSWIFEDVVPFLQARQATHRQSILTFGSEPYQMEKIHAAGITDLVSSIRVADHDRNKVVHLQELMELGSDPIQFIDDNTKHLEAVHTVGLPIELVRIKREGEEFAHVPHPLDDIAWRCVATLDDLNT